MRQAMLYYMKYRLEVTNITKAIALGGDIPALADALKDRDARLRKPRLQLANPVELPEPELLQAALELRSANWRETLRGPHVAQARVILQHLVELPMVILNEPKPKWMTAARPFGLGVGPVQNLASPTGFEPVFWP